MLPRYLRVGSDADSVEVPLTLSTAVEVAAAWGFVLPTTRIVDAVYDQAAVKLRPQPLPAGPEMTGVDYLRRHNEMVYEQRRGTGKEPEALTAGDQKDLVLTGAMWMHPDKVAIYGWHLAPGHPIQPRSTVHEAAYQDYSHGVRLVAATAYVGGAPVDLLDAMEDSRLAQDLTGEGVIREPRRLWEGLAGRR